MTRKLIIVPVLAALAVGVVILAASASAQVKKGKTRAAATKYLMRGIMKPNCASLGELLKGDGPENDKAWDNAACHASCVNEMSHLLMADGRCPDGAWAGAATKDLRNGSAEALAACEAKDLDAANAAFKTMTQACGACHKAHKKS